MMFAPAVAVPVISTFAVVVSAGITAFRLTVRVGSSRLSVMVRSASRARNADRSLPVNRRP